MAKNSRLLTALGTYQGRDYRFEHQKKLAKKAAKAKKLKKSTLEQTDGSDDNVGQPNGMRRAPVVDLDGLSTDRIPAAMDTSQIESESESEADEGAVAPRESSGGVLQAHNEDIPLSDIESSDDEGRGDIVTHQRVTINNPSALLQALKSIALPAPKLAFSEHQTVVSPNPSDILDVNDDLNRELAFYKQSLDAVKKARNSLKKEGAPFTRPTDYFAEMVKSDEHMSVIKKKMMDEAASKRAAVEARKQRDLRKFGKQVQVAKLQERDKAKRETMEKIQLLKRKRKGTGAGETNEEDVFDIALEDASEDKQNRVSKSITIEKAGTKRQKRDQKFGFGGKKRFSKSGDAVSSGDIKSFSVRRMKGKRKAPQRLGKSRRAKQS